MKLFKQFIREQRISRQSNIFESVIKPGKAYIINQGYEELDGPKDNYVLVGTVTGKLSVLLNSLYKLISKYDTILMYDVIFRDMGGSKIQVWVDKDEVDEISNLDDIEDNARAQADDMLDEVSPMVEDRRYEIVMDIINTFEAVDDAGQDWYDHTSYFWDEMENLYADGGY